MNATDNTVSGATSSFSIFGILGLEVDAVSISPSAATISLGGSQQFTAVAKSGSTDLPNRPIVWSTADPAVATVDAAGLVSAVAEGMTTVTATHTFGANMFMASAAVTVTLPVTTVTVAPASSDINVGGTVQLSGMTLGPSAEDLMRTIAWSSSDEAVATVDQTGLVTGVGVGSATITGTSEGVSGTATVNVTDPVTTVVVLAAGADPQDPSPSVLEGATVQLVATATRASGAVATGETTTWASDDEAVATVDQNGLVTGVGPGTATITATIGGVDGSEMVTVNINVASLIGTYTGAWVDNTFLTTGAASLVIALDQQTNVFTVMSDLDGLVYGIQNYPEETWTANYVPASTVFTENSATFGTLTLTINGDGTVNAEGLGAGGFTKVTWTGTIDQNMINLTWMLFSGATPTVFGTHILNKQP